MIDLLILIIILSAVVYRVSRFIVLDTMIDGTRHKVLGYLEAKPKLLPQKLAELLGCPFCVTVWISAGACLAWRIFIASFAAPVFVWLAVAAGALIYWAVIDSED